MTQALIDAYEAGGPLLVHATAGLTREQETTRIGPGEWSIAEVVAHLLDSDLVMADRMKRVIAEENPHSWPSMKASGQAAAVERDARR